MSNTNIEKNLKNLIKDSTCNPERVLYTITNNKGYGGFHLVNIIKNNNKNNILRIKNRTNIRKRSLKGALSTLGAGKDGTVYIGCLDQACKRMIAIKKAKEGLKIEYDIMNKIRGLSPHVPLAYLMIKCPDKELLYEQYTNGGDLLGFFKKRSKLIKPIHLKTILFQVLWTLYKIQKKFPDFRHNDLHCGNVLLNFDSKNVGGVRYKTAHNDFMVPNVGISAMINDFGWSDVAGIPNPHYNNNRNYKNNYGLFRGNSSSYDVYFFLMSVYFEMVNYKIKSPETTKFIKSVFSDKYIYGASNKVTSGRLKANANHTGIRSLENILDDPYFSGFRTKRRAVVARALVPNKLKTPPRLVIMPKPKSPLTKKKNTPSLCGKRARPKDGKGAERLTTGQMIELIKQKGYKLPKDRKRESLCAVIKEFKINVNVPAAAAAANNNSNCGKKARPKDGKGARRLTSKQMIELIKRKGRTVPKDRTRSSLCATIKEHALITPNVVAAPPMVAPVPLVAPLPAAPPPALKEFLKKVNVNVIRPKPTLDPAYLWKTRTRKMTEEIYNKMNKNNGTTYDERMDLARNQAAKITRNMKARGEQP